MPHLAAVLLLLVPALAAQEKPDIFGRMMGEIDLAATKPDEVLVLRARSALRVRNAVPAREYRITGIVRVPQGGEWQTRSIIGMPFGRISKPIPTQQPGTPCDALAGQMREILDGTDERDLKPSVARFNAASKTSSCPDLLPLGQSFVDLPDGSVPWPVELPPGGDAEFTIERLDSRSREVDRTWRVNVVAPNAPPAHP